MSSQLQMRDIGLGSTEISSYRHETEIGEVMPECFQMNSKLTSVVLLSVDQPLPESAFSGCTKLVEITLPGQEVFSNQIFSPDFPPHLTSVTVCEGTRDIRTAFAHLPSLTQLSLPSTIEKLDAKALEGDVGLTSLILSRSVQLEDKAFEGIGGLQQLQFSLKSSTTDLGLADLHNLHAISVLCPPEGEYRIQQDVFKGSAVRNLLLEDQGLGLQEIASGAFSGASQLAEADFRRSSVIAVPEDAFSGCTQLGDVRFSQSTLRSVAAGSFTGAHPVLYGNALLTSVQYPGTDVTYADEFAPWAQMEIGAEAFKRATLSSMQMSVKPTLLGNSAFEEAKLSALSANLQSVFSVPSRCFRGCAQLEHAYLDKVKAIGDNAFEGCTSMRDLSIAAGTHQVSVGKQAFKKCGLLSAFSFQEVSSIGENAFEECMSLSAWPHMLDAVKQISSYAFQDSLTCDILSVSTQLVGTPNKLGDRVFEGCSVQRLSATETTLAQLDSLKNQVEPIGQTLRPSSPAPADVKPVYERLKAYFGFASDFELQLADYVFNKDGTGNQYKCVVIDDEGRVTDFDETQPDAEEFFREPVIPSRATSIMPSVFRNMTQLTSIDLNNVTEIGDNAFAGCTQLKSFTSMHHLETIGDSAFIGCTQLSSADLISVKRVGASAFSGCIALRELSMPALQQYGSYAFSDCTSLSAVQIASAPMDTLASFGFSGCTQLKLLKLGDAVRHLDADSLNGLPSSLSVDFFQRTVDQLRGVVLLDNTCRSPVGAKFFTSDNDGKHPMMLTKTASQVYEVKDKSFEVQLKADSKLHLVKVDDTLLSPGGNVVLTPLQLEDLIIDSGALAGVSRVRAVDLNIAQVDNVMAGSLAGSPDLKAIYVDSKYNDVGGDMRKAHFISWVGDASDTKIYFTNGHLERISGTSWTFVVTNELFIHDGTSTTLLGINDSCITSPAMLDATLMPATFKIISTGALSTTVKLSSFTTLNGLQSIQTSAFFGNHSLKQVHLGSDTSLAYIGKDAFANTLIEAINLPSALHVADGYGLNKSFTLRSLTYDSGISAIAPSAMIDCESMLSSIEFQNPCRIESIGKYAFAETKSFFPYLEDVKLGDMTALTAVGDYAFYNSLRSNKTGKLTIPPRVLSVGAAAFGYAEDAWTQDLTALDAQLADAGAPASLYARNVQSIGPSAFIYNHFKDVRFNKEGLLSVGDYAFAHPKYKFSVEFPRTIQHIGANALLGNVILNPEKIEKNIISVALETTDDIIEVIHSSVDEHFEADNTIGVTDHTCLLATASDDPESSYIYAFGKRLHVCPSNMKINIFKKALVSADTSITSAFVPAYVTMLSAGAFQNCDRLLSVEAPGYDLQIGPSAFYNCPRLQQINGPNLMFTGNPEPYVFWNCQQLSNIRLLSSVTSIGKSAFWNCDALQTVQELDPTLLQYWQISSIGPSAFAECDSLSSFFIPKTLKSIDKTSFVHCPSLSSVTIDLDSSDFAKLVNPLSSPAEVVRYEFNSIRDDAKCRINFNDIVYMNDGNVKIDSEFVKLRQMDEGPGLSAVSAVDYMLLYEQDQPYLNLSAITQVDAFTFRGMDSLRSAAFLPSDTKHLQVIGDYAFSKCPLLARVNGNKLSCEVIGAYAFANDGLLNKLEVDLRCLRSIGQGAFYCTSLQELVFVTDQSDEEVFLAQLKAAIKFDPDRDLNPTELPEDCQILVKSTDGSLLGRYDFMLHSLLHSDIDISRNQIVFVDKKRDSIKPLLLVKPAPGCLPAITKNQFHASVVGRWK